MSRDQGLLVRRGSTVLPQMKCSCSPVAAPAEPIINLAEIRTLLTDLNPPWLAPGALPLYQCSECGTVYQVRFDRYQDLYDPVPLTKAVSALVHSEPTVAKVINAAASVGACTGWRSALTQTVRRNSTTICQHISRLSSV